MFFLLHYLKFENYEEFPFIHSFIHSFILIAFLFCGCSKNESTLTTDISETGISNESKLDEYAFETTDISVVRGLLSFESLDVYKKTIKSLRSLNANQAYKDNLLIDLGFNPDTEDERKPSNPLAQKFESKYNFNSLRSFAETESSISRNEDDIIAKDPMFQTVLNPDHEIIIDGKIHKIQDENRIILIADGSFQKLEEIRNAANVNELLPMPYVKVLDSKIAENRDFYDKAMMPPPPSCDPYIVYKMIDFDVYNFIDWRAEMHQGYSYFWTVIEQGTGVTIATGDTEGSFAVELQDENLPVIVFLTVTAPDGSCSTTTQRVIEMLPAPSCFFNLLVGEPTNAANEFSFFTTPEINCCNISWEWNFGDGTTFTDASQFSSSVSHAYPDNNSSNVRIVTCTVTNAGGCTATETITLTTGCGENQNDLNQTEEIISGSRRAKLDLFINDWIFETEAGAKIKHQRKATIGWKKTEADELRIEFTNDSQCILECEELLFFTDVANTNVETILTLINTDNNGNNIPNWDNIRARDGEVTANFFITENGEEFGPFTLGW